MDTSFYHSLTSPRKTTRNSYSDRLSERKRNLFGSSNDSNNDPDDLGPMQLLCENSNSMDQFSILTKQINEVNKENFNVDVIRTDAARAISPLVLSPAGSTIFSLLATPNSAVTDTPFKVSPTQALKTPHDTSTVVGKIPNQPRKSVSESTVKCCQSSKRKSLSPSDSPESKQSKVRTALFPAQSFYPKAVTYKREKPLHADEVKLDAKKHKTKSASTYLCNRKNKSRNRFGLINAGVRHKIRKPKRKKLTKAQLIKAALKIIENSPLNEYLDKENKTIDDNSTTALSQEQISKMDSIFKKMDEHGSFFNQSLSTVVTKTVESPELNKRKRSPSPDPNKKFFKTSRSRARTFTMNNNMKISLDQGKMTVLDEEKKKKRKLNILPDFDTVELSATEEFKVCDDDMSHVMNLLNDDTDDETKSTIVLTACATVSGSENSIHLHETQCVEQKRIVGTIDPDILLSPTSQMCDMTSGLALNSPRKSQVAKNLTANIDMCLAGCSDGEETIFKPLFPSALEIDMDGETKLYPIFYGGAKTDVAQAKTNNGSKLVKKYFKTLPADQMFLDVGQKRFELKQCTECNLIYHQGDPEDENSHLNYHNSVHVLRFGGWKNEHVVGLRNENKDRIVAVFPEDSKVWWKKINELLFVINRELGYAVNDFDCSNSRIFLYIKNRQIAGCIVAEPKTAGHKMLSGVSEIDTCSEESYPIKCGVSRIWVSPNYRKLGIATDMMNCMRKNFIYGYVLNENDIGLTPPTVAGKHFAIKYFKTNNFLIYES